MDFFFRGEDPDEKVDEVFGRNPTFDPADYENDLPGALVNGFCDVTLFWTKISLY